MHEYFENLIKPLVTNQSLENLLCKFKQGIISTFEDKLREQNLKIQGSESKIYLQKDAFKKLEILSSNNEQYSRCSCLRSDGIGCKEGDDGDVMGEMSWEFHLMKMKLTERMVWENHS